MRIAYLCADRGIPVGGHKGASIHVRAVAQALAALGHQVTVLALRAEGGPPPGFRPKVVELPFDRTFKDLRRSIDEEGRSVLSSELYGLMLNSVCHEGLAELERSGPVDAVYERYSLWSVAGLRYARSRRVPFLLEVNAPLVHEQQTYRDLELAELALGLERFLFREADALFVPSGELRAYVESRVGRRKHLHVVPNGADVELFAAPQPLPPAAGRRLRDRFVIAFVGSLKPWHGIEILLGSFEQLHAARPGTRLLIIGHGPLLSRIEALRRRLGEQVVQVLGEVPHQDIPRWLRLADVGVAPYPPIDEFYFSPLKVIEYMAAGLPVVASRIGQIEELVRHEATGLLVDAGSRDQLTAALSRLADDRRLRRRLGRKGLRRARSHYSWTRVAERIDAVLERLHGRYRGPQLDAVARIAGASSRRGRRP